jgi:hypothetical protein
MEKTEIPEFLRIVQDAVDDLSKMLDALQAHRPFYSELFKLYMREFHLKWTELVAEYYNANFMKFGVSHYISFLKILTFLGWTNLRICQCVLQTGAFDQAVRHDRPTLQQFL